MAAFPEEFDLDAMLADRQLDRPRFTFRFGGESYSLPPSIDLRAAAAMQAGDLQTGLSVLLGKDQWARLLASDATFDTDALSALMDRYAAYTGASLGESSASTGSSGSTGGPSKVTSNGSTTPILVR
jgi:hypothetical protein